MKRKSYNQLKAKWAKRVRIAEDVLAQLNADKFFAKSGLYIEGIPGDWSYNFSLRNSIAAAPKCNVCALGGMLASLACVNGDQKTTSPWQSEDLKELFGEKQMQLIEQFFECWNPIQITITDNNGTTDYELTGYDALKMRRKAWLEKEGNGNDDIRLRWCMQNIIDNRGKFVPPKYTKLTPNQVKYWTRRLEDGSW